MVNALALTAEVSTNFSDVKETDSCYNAVGVAKELGITSGVGNNKFGPNTPISRQDIMVLTVKALKLTKKIKDAKSDLSIMEKYSDKSEVSSYARESVSILIKEGLVVGDGKNINPRSNITREELATIIYKISLS